MFTNKFRWFDFSQWSSTKLGIFPSNYLFYLALAEAIPQFGISNLVFPRFLSPSVFIETETETYCTSHCSVWDWVNAVSLLLHAAPSRLQNYAEHCTLWYCCTSLDGENCSTVAAVSAENQLRRRCRLHLINIFTGSDCLQQAEMEEMLFSRKREASCFHVNFKSNVEIVKFVLHII